MTQPTPQPPPQNDDVAKTFFDRLTDTASVGVTWSVLIHAVLLTVMGLIVLPGLSDNRGLVVNATEVDSDLESFDSLVDVSFDNAGAADSTKELAVEVIPEVADTMLPVTTVVQNVADTENRGEGAGKTDGDGKGGRRMKVPSNAVRQGRFTAWTQPIGRVNGKPSKPGDSPQPRQNYYIVIQLDLPKTQRTYKVGDLSGEIIGTDGYRQQIPQRAYFHNDDGELVQATLRHRIPIIENTVRIMVLVPGAEFAAVRDRIRVESRRLSEKQQLELVFRDGDRRR